jgi:phosphoribosylformylglycinamidine synthase subunit PurS
MKVFVTVMPKPSVLDPQGAATAEAIRHGGMAGVAGVRIGKRIELDFPDGEPDAAMLEDIARDLLSNPVIEDFSISRAE